MSELREKANTNGGLLRESFGEEAAVVRMLEMEEGKTLPKGTIGRVELDAGKAGIVNANRRFYSRTVYALAVERAQELIKNGQFLGEVDHPWFGSLERAAFRFTKLYMDGDLMKGEGVILDTPGGRILKALLDGGVGVRVSTRGYGSAKWETMTVDGEDVEVAVIQEDFRLEGIDFVLFPSNPHGRVVQHEHVIHSQEAKDMNEEQLRREHPELVAAIEAAAREGMISREEHEAAVATAREDGRRAALEGEEVTSLRNTIAAVLEALKPHLPAAEQAKEEKQVSEAEKQVEALTQRVNELESKVTVLTTERDQLREAQEKAEREAAVASRISELLEGFAHADLLRPALEKCATVEAVNEAFEREKALIESVVARANVSTDPAGSGHADQKTPALEESDTPEDVAKAVERKLAGLSK